MTISHPVRRTGSCPACGGPGSAFEPDDAPDETSCTYCGASFQVTRPGWWCEACAAWLTALLLQTDAATLSDAVANHTRELLGREHRWPGLPDRTVGHCVSTTCEGPGCDAEINRGLAFLCGDRPRPLLLWGCGGFYCRVHLGSHRCTGFQDLSMHYPRTQDGEQVCDWDGDGWPCSPVRSVPDNPTVGRMSGPGAA